MFPKPGADVGKILADWLNDGVESPGTVRPEVTTPEKVEEMANLLAVARLPGGWAAGCLEKAGVQRWEDMPADVMEKCLAYAKDRLPAATSAA